MSIYVFLAIFQAELAAAGLSYHTPHKDSSRRTPRKTPMKRLGATPTASTAKKSPRTRSQGMEEDSLDGIISKNPRLADA